MNIRLPDSLRYYTGYVREILTYLTYPGLPKRNPRTKFVIITVGRTGSTLLVDLLNNHPWVQCYGELLSRRVLFPRLYLKCKERLSARDIYGFKIVYHNLIVQKLENLSGLLGELDKDGYKIINLKRRNILRQVISHMYALHTRTFHAFDERMDQSNYRLTIDFDFFQREMELFVEYRQREEQALSNLPCLQLYYEDDLLNKDSHQLTIDKVARYLGIPSAPIKTGLVKTTPSDLSSIIKNYDEFVSYLKNTEYCGYLDAE